MVVTNDPNEVTKDNFVCDPDAENKVWCKLEKYEFDKETGEKRAVMLQVRADNPGDFERFAPNWQKSGVTITMLHDPRAAMPKGDGVAEKLAKLNAGLNENENQNENGEETPSAEDWQKTVEAKELAEKRAAEAEEKLRLLEEKEAERAKAEEEARLKAEEEAKAKAETEAPSFEESQGESKTKGKTK